MEATFHAGNRQLLYSRMKPSSMLLMFSGDPVRKTNDEYYPFFAERNFVYLTGLGCKQAALLAVKDDHGDTTERLPANLLQAQRDYFGAHTYERVDRPRG